MALNQAMVIAIVCCAGWLAAFAFGKSVQRWEDIEGHVGSVVATASSPDLFIINEKNEKQLIPDEDTWASLHVGGAENIVRLDEESFYRFPLGQPIRYGTSIRIPDQPKKKNQISQSNSKSRGMILCAGNHMIRDSAAVVEQTRFIWKSKMEATVAHCGELSDESKRWLASQDIGVLDICLNATGGDTILGMSLNDAPGRLRGWFCKAGALVLSPYDETMVVDNDVIWFKNPDLLFDSPAYKRTGSLFFRDKVNGGETRFLSPRSSFYSPFHRENRFIVHTACLLVICSGAAVDGLREEEEERGKEFPGRDRGLPQG